MSAQKCVVEGCTMEYDVICSFSFYNGNMTSDNELRRQDWIESAMQDESECLWRHVSLQLCGYHFEMDNQGLWIDSPMLPELLSEQDKTPRVEPSAEDKKLAEMIRLDHNYSVEPDKDEPEAVSRLNVRQLVDTLGYLSLKNLQRKQLWVVKVETDKAEASIIQSEQVITKMTDPKQIIEIVPQTPTTSTSEGNESLVIEEGAAPHNFIYEIAEEQEITSEEVKEIPAREPTEWAVNIVPEETKPKYAYIKHCSGGKKKRHFTTEMNEISVQGDFDNYYILPDVDPSVGVEITTSYEPENFIVEEYNIQLEERNKKRVKEENSAKKKKKKPSSNQEKQDWVIENNIVFEQEDEFEDPKKAASRVRRKNKKYLGYDFVT